jgi:hypothetical protein
VCAEKRKYKQNAEKARQINRNNNTSQSKPLNAQTDEHNWMEAIYSNFFLERLSLYHIDV